MPRVPNIRPTFIYWLFDTRPETLVEYPNGRPFYCGKTVGSTRTRLVTHRSAARRYRHSEKPIVTWINNCGDNIQIKIMEVVLADQDWCKRERWWIYTIRLLYPGGANVAIGGEGAPGFVHTAEARARISEAVKQRGTSAETRSRISASLKGRVITPEWRAKLRDFNIGKSPSAETRAKISASGKGRVVSTETCAKIGDAHRGKTISIEMRERISATLKGNKLSAETRAKISASHKGKVFSSEHRVKLSAASKGRPKSAEHVANWKAARWGRS